MNITKGKIGNALTSTASDHTVAVAADIYDEELGKYQSDINASAQKLFDNLQRVLCCFGTGHWNNKLKWSNTSTWANTYAGSRRLEWLDIIASQHKKAIQSLDTKVMSLNSQIITLNGNGEGSVKKIAENIAKKIAEETVDKALNFQIIVNNDI